MLRHPHVPWLRRTPKAGQIRGQAMFPERRLAHFLGRGGEKNRTPIIHQPRALRMLAKSKDAGIRFAVARSDCINAEIIWMLIRDSAWTVRMAIACHPLLTLPMLDILLGDPEKPVREAAERSNAYKEYYAACVEYPLPGASRERRAEPAPAFAPASAGEASEDDSMIPLPVSYTEEGVRERAKRAQVVHIRPPLFWDGY